MSDNITKPWYQSKTIIAGLVALACNLGHMAGYDVPDDGELTMLVLAVLAAVSDVIAIYGRVDANQRIG